jgi:AcrR family transcriptional regulator
MNLKDADAKARGEGEGDSIRNRILSAAFAAFTEHGFTQASTLEIATRAKVSKRELYALVGNKQQMLVACIQTRGKRMRLPVDWPVPGSRVELEVGLAKFGAVLLHEISDPDVIATFRLAISEADRSPEVAQALQQYGRDAARKAFVEVLERAWSAGLLPRADPERMVGHFMSLLVGDVVMGLALGLTKRPGAPEIRRRASEAADAFLRLYPQDDGLPEAVLPEAALSEPRRRKQG